MPDSLLIDGQPHIIERVSLDDLTAWKETHGLAYDRLLWRMVRQAGEWQRRPVLVYREREHDRRE
jgi:hypothetical protein